MFRIAGTARKLNIGVALLNVLLTVVMVLVGVLAYVSVPASTASAAEPAPNPLLWDKDWGIPENNEAPHDFSADGQGNVYTVIDSKPKGGGKNTALLVKFDTNGWELWHEDLGEVLGETFIPAADKEGNVYVYGYQNELGSFSLRKYDPESLLLWTETVDSDYGNAFVSVDPKGEAVYVTTGINVGTDAVNDLAVMLHRYNSNGENPWNRIIDTDENDTANAVAAGYQDIYVAGSTSGSFPGYTFSGNGLDGFLARVSPEGDLIWVKQQNGLLFSSLAVDITGRAYTTQSELLYGYPSATSAARFELDSKCTLKIPLYFEPHHHIGIAVDGMFTIYVTGALESTDHPAFPNLGIEGYNYKGEPQFGDRIDMGIGPFSVSLGNLGDIYVAYLKEHQTEPGVYNIQSHLRKYEGNLIDSDGDGLPDKWEKNGVYIGNTFIDLPAMGADPERKDVFVEVDWMAGEDVKPEALKPIIDAFLDAPVDNIDGSTGISLHVDYGPGTIMDPNMETTWGNLSKANVISWQNTLGSKSLLGSDYQWDDFDKIKKANFDSSREPIFHYCVFACNLGGFGTTSGMSRGLNFGASDFIVSLGGWNFGDGGTAMEQAGTFMHELGHNLGLHHGGRDDIRYKPNYLSVMNYAFQSGGLIKKDAYGSWINGNYDYSIFYHIDDLDESALDESKGITSNVPEPDLENYSTIYYWVDPYSTLEPQVLETNGTHPIDWNWDLKINPGLVPANITSGPRGNADNELSVLESFEDWNRLIYKGGSIGQMGEAELPQATPTVEEITWEEDSAQPKLYAVKVSTPENQGVQPGGSSINYTFSVTNTGVNDDTYNIVATSSAGWANLSSVPATLALTSGKSREITIPVSVGSSTAFQDELILKAISQTSEKIWDVGSVITITKPTSIGTEEQVTAYGTSVNENIYSTALDGDWVVWEASPIGTTTYTVYARNLRNGEERTIASRAYSYNNDYNRVDISGNLIVYEENPRRFGSYPYYVYGADIMVYDLVTDKYLQITSDAPCMTPKIDGDRVVYMENEDIYMYDLSEKKEYPIHVDINNLQIQPDISGDNIVWIHCSSTSNIVSNYDIYMYNLSTGTERAITTNPFGQNYVRIDGTRIVWDDTRNQGPNVYMYDLATSTETRVTTTTNPSGINNYWGCPTISGNHIAWLDYRTANLNGGQPNVYVYDITSGTQSLIASSIDWNANTTVYPRVRILPTYPSIDNGRILYGKQTIVAYGFSHFNLFMTTVGGAPETSLSTDIASVDGWFNAQPQITLTPDKAGVSTYYQWDDSSSPGWAGYTRPFSAPEGEHVLYYYSADALGNTEAVKNKSFKVDLIPPETMLTTAPSSGNIFGGIFKVLPQISLATGEAGTATYYQWDSASGSWTTYSTFFPGRDGEHTLYYYSIDEHGNAEAVRSQYFHVDTGEDTLAPTTELSSVPPFPENEVPFVNAPVVTLTVDETAATYYRWDEPPTGAPGSALLPVSMLNGLNLVYAPYTYGPTVYWGNFLVPQGVHTLYYFSIDPSGNVEEMRSREFVVGEQPSIISVILSSTATDPTNVLPIPVTATFSEAVTGLEIGEITVTNGTAVNLAGDGAEYTFEVTPTAQGLVTVSISAGAAQGAEDNGNTTSNTLSRTYQLDSNGSPDAVNDGDPIPIDVAEDSLDFAIDVLANDSDPDGDPLTITLVSDPANGTVDVNDNDTPGDAADDYITYTPDSNYNSADSFTYTISDSDLSDTATVYLEVTAVNDPPVPGAIGNKSIPWGNQLTFNAGATDIDLPADTLTFSLAGGSSGLVPDGAAITAGGVFSWTPASTQIGIHTFDVEVTDDGSPKLSDRETITVEVQKRATKVTYSGDTSGQWSDPVTLRATLSDNSGGPLQGTGLEGKTISFTVGTQSGSGLTDASGLAETTIILEEAASSCAVDSRFAGEDLYLASSDSDPFIVQKETIHIKYIGDTFLWVNFDGSNPADDLTSVNLKAIFRQDEDGSPGDLKGLGVIFRLGNLSGGPSFEYAVVAHDSNGAVQMTTPVEVPAGLYEILVRVVDNQYFTSAIDIRTISVANWANRASRVEGSGDVLDGDATFGFNVRYAKQAPAGFFNFYYEREEGGVLYKYIVNNNSWAKGGLYFLDQNQAYFESKATVKKINMATGENVYTSGNGRFYVQVTGDQDVATGDYMAVRIYDGKAIAFETGTLASTSPAAAYAGEPVNGGQIVVIQR